MSEFESLKRDVLRSYHELESDLKVARELLKMAVRVIESDNYATSLPSEIRAFLGEEKKP